MIISKSALRRIVKEEIAAAFESMDLEQRSDAALVQDAEAEGHEDLVVYAEPGILDDDSREKIITALSGGESVLHLSTPTEDPLGRGARTTALRRKAMRKKYQ